MGTKIQKISFLVYLQDEEHNIYCSIAHYQKRVFLQLFVN